MSEKHTVRAEFELDDHSHHTLEHIKEGFEHVEEKAHEVGGEVAGIFKNAIGTAIGFQLSGMVETFKEMGHEVFEAAAGMEEQEHAIRGVLLAIDEEGASLEDLTKEAHELNEEFTGMGIETGASKASIVSAFDEMAERTGLATGEVKELTGEMAQAGRAVGGVDALSTGFSNLASGIIRAKNPVVQLIRATGTLHGTAKQIAQQMMKMSPEQSMKLGIAAVEKMSAKMKSVPLTFKESVASMKVLREQIFETLGTPVLSALGGPLGELRKTLIDNKEAIAEWAHGVGVEAGEWVKSAAAQIKEGFHYLQSHSSEIKQDIKEAMAFVRSTVQFIIDHRTAIAIAWGAPKLWGASMAIAQGGMKAGSALLSFGGKLASGTLGGGAAVAESAAGGAGALGGEAAVAAGGAGALGGEAAVAAEELLLVASTGASIAALGLFIATVGSVSTAVYEGVQLWHEMPSKMDDANARMRALEKAAEEGHLEWAQTLRDALVTVSPEVAELANHLRDLAATNARTNAIESAYTSRSLAFEEGEAGKGGQRAQYAVQTFMGDLDSAVGRQDKATLEHMATFLTTHQNLLDAMHTAGVDMTKEGSFLVGALENLSGGKGHMVAEEIQGILDKQKKAASKAASDVKENHMYFTGPITIQQDFKNTDPDRIAIVFKRHLARSALAKTSAATQVPHTAF